MIAGFPLAQWTEFPRWGVIHVRVGVIGSLLLMPIVTLLMTLALTVWLVKLTVLILMLFVQAIVAISNAVQAWSLRHADESEEPEGKVG